jgi:hypothetical protein
MDTKRLLFAMLGAVILTSACERTTSVGAAGQYADAAMDADPTVDADTGDRPPDADAATPTPEELCTTSGGTVTTSSFCMSIVAPFPDTCAVGSCSPANSHTIGTCNCPEGQCFSPGVGCLTQTVR